MISGTGGPNPEAPANGNRADLTAFRFGWTLFLVLATSAPYIWNFFATPPGAHYTWILPPYPEDSFGYLAWTRQAADGHFLFQLKFTALPHSAFLFNPFFLLAGGLTRLFAGNAGLTLFALKEIGVVCFLLALFKYLDHLGFNRFQSIVATVLVGISSGVGGLLVWLGLVAPTSHVSGDLWLVDMNTYWSLLWNPLFPWSLTLLLLSLFWLDRGSRDGRKSDFWLAGATTGILALIHPYSQPLLFTFAVIIVFWRAKEAALGRLFRFFAAALPFVVYIGSVTAFHPLISRHDYMGQMSSPSPVVYILGFGLPLLFCALGLVVDCERFLKHCGPLLLWLGLSVVLAYVPFWFQRKLIFGAHVPLCLMAAFSADLLLNRFSDSRVRGWLTAAGTVILLPVLVSTPVYLLAAENREVRNNADGYYYVSRDMMEGLDFLRNHTRPADVVFARVEPSRLIPGLAGNTVLWGHWAMSVDLAERQGWITNLFNPHADWSNPGRARAFWSTNIQYLFAEGDFKQSLESRPREWSVILNGADLVFTNSSVIIYRRPGG